MINATHYIECYVDDERKKEYQSPVRDIEEIERNLKLTKPPLRTVAVWKIRLKPGVVVARYDQELNATIIEDASK